MRCQVLEPLKIKTLAGEWELRPGQVVKLPRDKATPLIASGKIQRFCYWKQQAAPDCENSCFLILPGGKLDHECKHFSEYWQKRLHVSKKETKQG